MKYNRKREIKIEKRHPFLVSFLSPLFFVSCFVLLAAPAAPAKTSFSVKLNKFDAAVKIKLIKEVRTLMPSLGLKEVIVLSFPSRFKFILV